MAERFTAKEFLMEANTSSNEELNPSQTETYSSQEAELLGALEETAISLRDAEDSIKINEREISNGKQG